MTALTTMEIQVGTSYRGHKKKETNVNTTVPGSTVQIKICFGIFVYMYCIHIYVC